jgi:hypothetical protein
MVTGASSSRKNISRLNIRRKMQSSPAAHPCRRKAGKIFKEIRFQLLLHPQGTQSTKTQPVGSSSEKEKISRIIATSASQFDGSQPRRRT